VIRRANYPPANLAALHFAAFAGIARGHPFDYSVFMIDKIGPSRPTSPAARAAKAKRASATSSTAFSEALSEASATADATSIAEASGSVALGGVGALLGAQEVSEKELSQQKLIKNSQLTLDSLAQLRDAMLNGNLPIATIRQLEKTLQQERNQTLDPRLSAVLDDIELRVSVELAKLEMSGIL
jgi:flagellar motor switch/type III secretory pathway protein FliN